jgi:hypothetical protein
MEEEFNNQTLHDAILRCVTTDWRQRTCEAQITLVGGRHISVVWSNLAHLVMPHASPWGESASINGVRTQSDGSSEIEMQSGDIIRIKAGKPEMK